MKDFKKIRKHRRLYRTGRWASRKFGWLIRAVRWLAHKLRFLRIFRFLNPFRYIRKLDWYIIKKFLGYYFFSIALIISIAIVFDFNENLSKFTEHHAPARAIIFDYYANFVPYFANLFSALFVFVAVILFTSKLASNSEIIAILASGVSFKRLLRPYMITCVLLSALSFGLSAYVIPHGTVIRQNFETMYKNKKKNTSAENVQLQVDKGVIAYMQHYDNSMKRGYGFCLDKFQDKKLVSHLTAMDIQYDTISDSKYHWQLSNWKIRKLQGMKEHITSGAQKDTIIMMEPTDLVYSKGQQETFPSPVRGRIPQAHRLFLRFVHPHHHRCLPLSPQAQRRHGSSIGRWTCAEFRLHHAADGFCHLRHPGQFPACSGSVASKLPLRHRSLLLLPQGTEVKSQHSTFNIQH